MTWHVAGKTALHDHLLPHPSEMARLESWGLSLPCILDAQLQKSKHILRDDQVKDGKGNWGPRGLKGLRPNLPT